MFRNFKVKIPYDSKKVTLQNHVKYSYVLYEVERKYDDKKGYNSPKRITIGKMYPDNTELMYPHDTKYKEVLKRDPVLDKVQDVEPAKPLYETVRRSSTLKAGTYIAIKKVIEEYELKTILEEVLGDDAGLLLDLASFMIVEEDNAAQHYPEYAYCHPLFSPNMHVYSDSSVSRLLQSISKEQIIDFLERWNKKRDHHQRIYVSYDSTNKNCQAGDIDIVEFGHAKLDAGNPIYNVSVAFDVTNKVPLLFETYPGSIVDVSQVKYTIEKFIAFKYSNIGFIFDRGYFSKANFIFLDEHKIPFIIMVKGCKNLVSSQILQYQNTFERKSASRIPGFNLFGRTIKTKIFSDDTKERYLHLYFSTEKLNSGNTELMRKIDSMESDLEKLVGREKEDNIDKCYRDYFDLIFDKNDVLVSFSINNERFDRALALCGYFAIITSEEMTAAEALILYKGRDISEKLFAMDKTFLGSDCARVHSQESLESKQLVCFIALIIRNRLYNLLKDELLRLNVRKNYFTVPAALGEFGKVEMVRINHGEYKLDHALTKSQKELYRCFGMDEDAVCTEITKIANALMDAELNPVQIDEPDDEKDNDNLE